MEKSRTPISELITKDPVTEIIAVNNIVVKQETEEVEIPYNTEERNTDRLLIGEKETVQAGVNGLRRIVYNVSIMDGVEVGREEIENMVIKPSVKEIIEIGTRKHEPHWLSTCDVFNLSDNAGSIVLKADAELNALKSVKVDGILLDTADYTASSGSTIVMLKDAYCRNLSEGDHNINLTFSETEHYAAAELSHTVKVISKADNTGTSTETTAGSTTFTEETSATPAESTITKPEQVQITKTASANLSDKTQKKVPHTGEITDVSVWGSFVLLGAAMSAFILRRKIKTLKDK